MNFLTKSPVTEIFITLLKFFVFDIIPSQTKIPLRRQAINLHRSRDKLLNLRFTNESAKKV